MLTGSFSSVFTALRAAFTFHHLPLHDTRFLFLFSLPVTPSLQYKLVDLSFVLGFYCTFLTIQYSPPSAPKHSDHHH